MSEQQIIEQNGLPKKNNQVIIFKTEDDNISIDVRFESETAWLTQAHLAELFQTSRPNITMHIKNILASSELEENVVSKNFLHTTEHGAIEGKTQTKEVKYYNLDMIISLGYRINSKVATKFRQWATLRLKEYIVNAGTVSHSQAIEKAHTEYKKYVQMTLSPIEQEYLNNIKMLSDKGKKRNQKS